jgi:glutaredoxin
MFELQDKGYSIFTKENCKWCKKIKLLLPDAHYIHVEIPPPPSKYRQEFFYQIDSLSKQQPRTFPIVFYNKHFIGGYKETKERIESFNFIFDTNIF